MAPEILYVLLIIFKFVVLGIQLWLGRTMFRLPLRTYLKAMTRYVLPVLAVGLFLMFVPWKEISGVIQRIILSVLSVEGILLLTIYLVGFEMNERRFIIEQIQQVSSKIIKR